jgi:16S rRNA (guanine527-N7)-methyltransferase
MPAADSADSAVSSAELRRRVEAAGLRLADTESASLAAFVRLLLKWNKVYNLTGVRGVDEIVDRHLVESLALRPYLQGARVADVGSGGGLPGIPLAIVEPQRRFTLIESRAKRVRFLRHVVAELPLANAEVAHARAEDLRVERPFDTVLARAVAPPAELLEVCRHLTAPGSLLLLLTAAHLQDAFRGLAPDFIVRPAAAAGPKLRSSIVLLERVNAERRDVTR